MTPEHCATLVDYFEDCNKAGWCYGRDDTSDIREDKALSIDSNTPQTYWDIEPSKEQEKAVLTMREDGLGTKVLNTIYGVCSEFYTKKWPLLSPSTHLGGATWKIQKTTKGQGYHVWHQEAESTTAFRTLVWTLYLTDIEDDCGGETQFLYYPHSCKPKVGRMMLFPAGFTHHHRGNIYWGHKPKYIATGWLFYDYGQLLTHIGAGKNDND